MVQRESSFEDAQNLTIGDVSRVSLVGIQQLIFTVCPGIIVGLSTPHYSAFPMNFLLV
jgi:hypothetical protein